MQGQHFQLLHVKLIHKTRCVTGRTNLSHHTYRHRCPGLFKITLSKTAQFAVFAGFFLNVCILLRGIWLQEHLTFYSCGNKAKTAIGNGISWIMFCPSAHQDSPIQTISQMFLPPNSTEPLDLKVMRTLFCTKKTWLYWITKHGSVRNIFPYKSVFLAGEEGDNIHACTGKLLEGKVA